MSAAETVRLAARTPRRLVTRYAGIALLAVCFVLSHAPLPGLAAQVTAPLGAAVRAPHKADDKLYTPPSRPAGFSSNPFSLDHRDPEGTPKPLVLYKDGRQEKLAPGTAGTATAGAGTAGTAPAEPAPLRDGNADLNITVRKKEHTDRLSPDRTTFSGGEHTLSRMDEKKPAEVSMDYRVNENTNTSVTLNPQDAGSPLHRPAGQDDGLNGAGVYMNVEVQPNLQMKVGGEYCEIESRHSQREETAKGAIVGLEWSF